MWNPDSDLVNLNELQKEEIAGFVQLIPKKKETGKKILIIDDSDQIRWFLKLALGKEYQIFEARNGEERCYNGKKNIRTVFCVIYDACKGRIHYLPGNKDESGNQSDGC